MIITLKLEVEGSVVLDEESFLEALEIEDVSDTTVDDKIDHATILLTDVIEAADYEAVASALGLTGDDIGTVADLTVEDIEFDDDSEISID